MTSYEDITYLTQFIKFVDDNHVGKLISYIYNINNFYNPYDSNMELFLNLILYDNYQLNLGNYSLKDLESAKNECIKFSYDEDEISEQLRSNPFWNGPKDIRIDKIIKKCGKSYMENNLYLILENALKSHKFVYKGKEFEYTEDVTTVNELLPVFNNIFIPFDKVKRNLFIKQIVLIMKTILCFEVKISDSEYGNFINSAIDAILPNSFLYVIENNDIYCYFITPNDTKISKIGYFGKRQLLEKDNRLYLYDVDTMEKREIKHKTSIRNYNKHSLLGIKSINSFIQSFASLDAAWEEIDNVNYEKNNNKNKKVCPICSPLVDKKERNTKQNHKKTQMCDDCKKIFKEIREIDPEYTTERIRTMVKLRSDKERTLSARVLKEKHYEKLKKILRNINKKCDIKRMEHIQTLVDIAFQVK